VIDYKVLEKKTTNIVADEVKALQAKYTIPSDRVVVDADGVGGGVVDQLPGCVSFVNGSSPKNKENYANLKSQCYYKLAQHIVNREIYIPNLEDSIQIRLNEELEQVKRKDPDKDGKLAIISKDQVKVLLGRSPDASDGLMLRMLLLLKPVAAFDVFGW
jgi:hypothetical protein